MIVAVVTFRYPPEAFDADRFMAAARERRGFYEGLAGLREKIYWVAPERAEAGGIYLWESREAAERVYSPEWRARAADAFGASPEVRYAEVTDLIVNGPVRLD